MGFSFKTWLAETSLRDIIKPIPQSPVHHAEGDVWKHTRLVRKQLADAIEHFQQLTTTDPLFGDLDPNFSSADMNLLRLAAWLHDIGKASATTNVGGKIQAIGHEDPEHFEPMMQQLGEPWQSMYQKASPQDKEDLWYVIQNHMSLKSDGFSHRVLAQLVEPSGKFRNDRRTKLLLILILMDQSGRIKAGEPHGREAMPGVTNRMGQSATDYNAKMSRKRPNPSPAPDDPQEFLRILRSRNLSPDVIQQAFRGKFGRDF